MDKCDVCKKNHVGKYKCPSCYIRYCSKSCFVEHKGACKPSSVSENSEGAISQESSSSSSNIQDSKTSFSNIDLRDLVPMEKLKSLREDESVKELLRNPHLCNLLRTINDSKNPEDIMQKAMLEPLFTEFADVCLKKLEPLSDDET